MAKFFVDANVFLDFFTGKSGVERLLKSLLSVGEDLFVTEQIVNEVHRNKLKKAGASMRSALDSLDIQPFPIHLCDGESAQAFKKEAAELAELVAANRRSLLTLQREALQKLSESRDPTSIGLSELFSRAKVGTALQVEKASLRKTLGHPPGKRNDPVGDQLSWTQLLESYDGFETLWIVTRDKDFFSKVDKVNLLNPVLYTELQERCSVGNPDVRVFESLAGALKDYSSGTSKSKNLSNELKRQRIEEIESRELEAQVAMEEKQERMRMLTSVVTNALMGLL